MRQAEYRSSARIDQADSLAHAANSKGVELDSRVDALLGRLDAQATKSRRNGDKIEEVRVTADVAADGSRLNAEDIGGHAERLAAAESALSKAVSDEDLSERLGAYVRTDDLPDQDMAGYARWSDFEGRDVATKTLRSGVLELTGDDPDAAATLTHDGGRLTLVSGIGNPPTRIAPDGIEFGGNALRIDEDGDVAYCKGGSGGCRKIQLEGLA